MTDRHLSTQFEEELTVVSARVLELGGLAESQVTKAFSALVRFAAHDASLVLQRDGRLHAMGTDIDRELTAIIVRRQPAARDLRSVVGFSKAIAHLERIGAEAARIAHTVQRFLESGVSKGTQLPLADIGGIGKLAIASLRQGLDALSDLDAARALQLLKSDDGLATQVKDLAAKLTAHLTHEPSTMPFVADLVLVANSLERVGQHARNLSELVVYIVDGVDEAMRPT